MAGNAGTNQLVNIIGPSLPLSTHGKKDIDLELYLTQRLVKMFIEKGSNIKWDTQHTFVHCIKVLALKIVVIKKKLVQRH
jgi:hypothetical protein